MGIKIPLHKKKGGDKVADNPPPVFNRHAKGEELLKGHKFPPTGRAEKSVPPKLNRSVDLESNHSNGGASNSSITSSTALWVAQANANSSANNGKDRPKVSDNPSRKHIDDYDDEDDTYTEEYFEEEIIEEDIPLSAADDLPPRRITIRFDEFDEMQTILHINDYTKHEISRSWYKRDDYDKMVMLARKTAQKVEERTRELGRKVGSKTAKKIEYRGLEAWTSMGAAKVKILKESTVEVVWNEQSRQWDLGINDVDRIREVYQIVSKGAQQVAQDRGFSDELIAKRIRQIEAEEKEMKQKRKLLGKSKALIGKSVKVTAGGVVKTARLGVKTTKLTGKVAIKTGKVATKTAVATATLDRKMLKEAFIPEKKKRECEPQTIRIAAQSIAKEEETEGKALTTCPVHSCFFVIPTIYFFRRQL
jgi:hypothetical protein